MIISFAFLLFGAVFAWITESPRRAGAYRKIGKTTFGYNPFHGYVDKAYMACYDPIQQKLWRCKK